MKTLSRITLGTLAASLLTLNVASATTPTNDEIFSAIDSEYVADTSRVNFALSSAGASGSSLNDILAGIDGEYGHSNIMSKTSSHGSVSELPKTHD